jgi:hypothetical protein
MNRVVLFNPHIDPFIGYPVLQKFAGSKLTPKYNWLRFLCELPDFEVGVFVDGVWTSGAYQFGDLLTGLGISDRDKRIEICVAEAKRWCVLSGFPLEKVRFLTHPSQLCSGDVIFTFSDRFLDAANYFQSPFHEISRQLFSRSDLVRLVHLTHYPFNIRQLSRNLEFLGIRHACCEADLSRSPFFKKYFPYMPSVNVIPFAVKQRFRTHSDWSSRSNECIATGMTLLIEREEFNDFFGTNEFHPIRMAIIKNEDRLSGTVKSFVSRSDTHAFIPQSSTSLYFDSLTCGMQEFEERASRNSSLALGDSYYKFDIVESYNQYKYCVVGEELCFIPGIGLFEGMACGAAPIATDGEMYTDIGMKAHENYIPYDGTLDGLLRAIKWCRDNDQVVRGIAFAAAQFAVERLSEFGICLRFAGLCQKLKGSLRL